MAGTETIVKPTACNISMLREMYKVGWKTIKKWLKTVPDLGDRVGGMYTPAQVQKIFNHLGTP